MLKSHAAVWASDAPTPAQLKELFGQIEKGKVTKDSLQAFLRGEPVVRGLLTDAEHFASKILGYGKVLGYRDVCRVQKVELPEVEPVMSYPEDLLRECAEANIQGAANWRLAYVVGHSLRKEREIMGWNRKKQPCFDPDYTWWLENNQDSWATKPIESGYRLLDFTKRFASTLWGDQGTAITKLGADFKRAEEQAVAEVCFSNYLISPTQERLMPNWYHWGNFQASTGYHVCVGDLDRNGFRVGHRWDDYPNGPLGVVVAR